MYTAAGVTYTYMKLKYSNKNWLELKKKKMNECVWERIKILVVLIHINILMVYQQRCCWGACRSHESFHFPWWQGSDWKMKMRGLCWEMAREYSASVEIYRAKFSGTTCEWRRCERGNRK